MFEAIASPWAAYAVLVALTVAARLRSGSWLAPAAFVGLVWSFFTGGSLLVTDYSVPGRGLWMLVVLISAVQLGAMIAQELRPRSGILESPTISSFLEPLAARCRRYGLICATVALVGCAYFLFWSLQEFDLPFTPLSVLEVGAKWTALRYADAVEPWSVRLLVTWFHPAGLLGGVLFAGSRKRLDRWIGGLTLLPAAFYGVFIGARAPVLLWLTCWIGGYFATQCIRNRGKVAMFTIGRSIALLGVGVSMLAVFGGVDAIRGSSDVEAGGFELHEQRLGNYVFGSPAAFAVWYSHAELAGVEWGARTFTGEFDLLHIKARHVAMYSDLTNVIGTEYTNVYTLFRGLIEDFTAFGAVLIAAAVGALAGWVYHTSSSSARSGIFWLSMFYSTFLFSPLVSLFTFNGAALAWVVAWLVVRTTARPLPDFVPTASPRPVAL